jgi:tetratricopeptide (TPR) repeat protein
MHADALSAIKKAIEIDREEPAYHFNISRLYMEVGAFCNAVETLSECIETSGRIQNDYYLEACYLYRAYCHLRIGHLADAEQDLERVTDDAKVWMDGLIGKLEILEACRQHRRI